MKTLYLILFLFMPGIGLSQGLNAELGFNDDYSQSAKAVVCSGEFSYLVKYQKTSSFFSTCSLYKIDTVGTIIWNSPIMPVFAEYTEVYEMIPSQEGGVYVMGFGMPTCDVGLDCFWFIQKFDPAVGLVWTKTWTNSICGFQTSLSGLSITNANELLVNYLDSASNSIVYTLNSSGLLTDSVQINYSPLRGFCEIPGYEFVAFKNDSLFAFDANGNNVSAQLFNTAIQNIVSLNDSLHVLSADSIFILDTNLTVLQGSMIPGYAWYSNLKVSAYDIKMVSSGTGNHTVLELDKQLQLQNAISIPVAANFAMRKDFSNSHFSTAIDFPITLHHAIRYLDFSLNSTQAIPFDNADVGVIDVDITQTALQAVNSSGVYQYQIWANAKVKNFGNTVVNSSRISHRVSIWGICSEFFYTNDFFNLSLAPNDTIWINLGMVHANTNQFFNTIAVDLCVYTSHPNHLTDTIVPNDQLCTNVYLGTVGISENAMQNVSVFPNPVKDVINIENPDSRNLTVIVCNYLGEIIAGCTGTGSNLSIDLSGQNAGLYLVRIISKDAEITEKILKQ